MGTVGLLTTEKVGTAIKAGMTDGTKGHRVPRMITLRMIIGMMTEPPNPNPKLNLKPWDIPKEDASFASTSQ